MPPGSPALGGGGLLPGPSARAGMKQAALLAARYEKSQPCGWLDSLKRYDGGAFLRIRPLKWNGPSARAGMKQAALLAARYEKSQPCGWLDSLKRYDGGAFLRIRPLKWKTARRRSVAVWSGRRDSNPHGRCPRRSERRASAFPPRPECGTIQLVAFDSGN